MDDILSELITHDTNEQGLPPGFRFHPTDEELITFYLASKLFNRTFSPLHIPQLDLNRCEPWHLPDVAKMGEREWYFFTLRDRKYPTGLRTNRATDAGYWKATGKDRQVYSACGSTLVGMKKTLVFYKGRAPRGEKTKWVMHEYRLHADFSCRHPAKEEWVICRIFHKMAEKKIQTPLMQTYLTKSNPISFPDSLPPLLEQTHHPSIIQTLNQNQNQNPFLISTQESDIKTLIDPLVYFPNSIDAADKLDSILYKPYMSNQDLTLKELSNAIAKQCKKEPEFGLPYDEFSNMRWAENIEDNQNSFVFGGMGNPSAAVEIDHVMSTEATFRWW